MCVKINDFEYAEFGGHILTTKEYNALNELLQKMRAEEAHQRLVQKCKNAISFEIAASIDEIGLDVTKTIVRALARELRDVKSGGNA